MQYSVFKNILDIMVKEFPCPSCQKSINDESVNLHKVEGNNIDMIISCHEHIAMQTQVQNLSNNTMKITGHTSVAPIQDTDIVALHHIMKDVHTVDGLFASMSSDEIPAST
jgi:hypothetical protein